MSTPTARSTIRLFGAFGLALVVALTIGASGAGAQGISDEPAWSSGDFVWPLSGTQQVDAPITSPYGPRLRGSQDFAYDYHRGIDVKTDVGTPIYAIAAGTVRIAGDHPAYSDTIVQLKLTKPGQPNLYVNYAHLSAVAVDEGQFVEQGELLGHTGISESGFAHLHFEIRQAGLYQKHARNPMSFLPYAPSGEHTTELDITQVSTAADGSGRDVIVRVTAALGALDIDAVRLSVHTERSIDSPAPLDLGVEPLDGWGFGLEALNSAQTPIVNSSSDTSILDQPLVVLDPTRPIEVVLSPGRFDGRNPPWDIATYEFRFLGVPIPDPAAVPYHLLATTTDTSGNAIADWSSPVFATNFARVGAPNFHTGNGAPLALRVEYSGPLDPADELDINEVSCSKECSIAVTEADYSLGIFDLIIDPASGPEELVVTVASGALADSAGRPTGQATTRLAGDNWPPEIVGSIDRAPNQERWLTQPATIEWQVSDPAPSSGLAANELQSVRVDRLGMRTYESQTVCDLIGNCRRGEFTVGFDNIAPIAMQTAGPGPGDSVLLGDHVEPTCTATDEHSGVSVEPCVITTTSVLIEPLSELVAATAVATDLAGNTVTWSWSFTVTRPSEPDGVRSTLRSIASDLMASQDLDPNESADIARAVTALADLDDDGYWLDENRLADNLGPTSFRIGQIAVRAIDHLDRPETQAATLQLIAQLRTLSVLRIDDATTNNGNPMLLDRAMARLESGHQFAEAERFSRASTYYRYAWYWARQAARNPVEPAVSA